MTMKHQDPEIEDEGSNADATVQAEEDFIEIAGGTLFALSPETGQPVGEPIVIGVSPVLVGRGAGCNMVLLDPQVSISHCQLVASPEGVRVTDLSSTNGTYVNQVRAFPSVCITGDSRLTIGQTSLGVRIEGRDKIPISTASAYGALVGHSKAMRALYAQLGRIELHEFSVLITGETGTGKELVAKAIHESSRRRRNPFVVINCPAIPPTLAESELFGHERGSFTGAVTKQSSPFDEAEGGTVFFDELGDLALDVQAKLLRALETREIKSIGAKKPRPINVRIVAATRKDLSRQLNDASFREDLFFRFNQVAVEVPPLRERREDIPYLVARFLADEGDASAVTRIDKHSMERLKRYDWPGNVRELRHLIQRAHVESNGGPIDLSEFLGSHRTRNRRASSYEERPAALSYQELQERKREFSEQADREYFSGLLEATGGNISEMERRSGLSRPTIRRYLERYGLRTERE